MSNYHNSEKDIYPFITLYSSLASAYYIKKDYGKVIEYLQKILSITPEELESYSNILPDIHNLFSTVYFQQKDYNKAISHCKEMLALLAKNTNAQSEYSDTGTIHYNIVRCYLEQDNYTEALYHCKEGLAVTQKYYGEKHHYNIGFIIC